jgi:quercetin dioxygenase-like cupin family protein
MRVFSFDAKSARPLTEFGSVNASITPIARPGGFVQVGCMRLAAGGVVGMHPATIPQLFLVVAGEGWVRVSAGTGSGERVPIQAGQAAFWEAGEEHESGTEADVGMTAMVVEADQLDPGQYMQEELT